MEMTKRAQFLICVMVFLLAILAGVYMAYPACTACALAVEESKGSEQELHDLQSKLNQIKSEDQKRHTLEGQIDAIRNAVPKEPGIELVMIDLQKICKRWNVDLISVEAPEPNRLAQLNASEQEVKNVANSPLAKTSMGSKSLKRSAEAVDEALNNNSYGSSSAKGANNVDDKKQAPSLLEHAIKQVYISGSFDGMAHVLEDLESYERIVDLSQIAIAVPSEDNAGPKNNLADKAKKLELERPLMSFLLKVYYLP